jgi:hypothetical protein
MKDWLSTCQKEHRRCPQQEDSRLPTRVIDVGTSTREPRLVVTGGRSGKWTALSHCWGSYRPLKTESKTLESYCKSLPLSALPPTFRDAIIITRALGVQYLWIDSLCILQDSKSDWLAESTMMGSTYKNAVVTIAADASPDSSVGIVASSCHDKQDSMPYPKTQCHSPSQNLGGFLRLRKEDHEQYTERGPLSQRGWTLQEEILAPRILQFTRNVVFWRCVEARASEIFPDIGPTGSKRLDINPYNISGSYHEAIDGLPPRTTHTAYVFNHDILTYWYGPVVDAYILRQLTYESDKLIAIAGIAREIQSYTSGSHYKAGIWLNDIHRGLLWSPIRDAGTQGAVRYKEYVAPSWSWASIDFSKSIAEKDTRYIYSDLLRFTMKPLADIYDVKVSNVNDDSFGQVKSGSLTIRGECCSVCSCRVPLAFLDERDFQYEDNAAAWRSYILNRPWSFKEVKDKAIKPSFFDTSNISNAAGWGYYQLQMGLVGTQECIADKGVKHDQLLYVKIARCSTQYEHHVVVGLILQSIAGEDVFGYRRVGRAIMTEDETNAVVWLKSTVIVI